MGAAFVCSFKVTVLSTHVIIAPVTLVVGCGGGGRGVVGQQLKSLLFLVAGDHLTNDVVIHIK